MHIVINVCINDHASSDLQEREKRKGGNEERTKNNFLVGIVIVYMGNFKFHLSRVAWKTYDRVVSFGLCCGGGSASG